MSTKEKTIIAFDATELDNFEMCKFRWHAFHHKRLIPKKTETHFERGTLLHYILEQHYRWIKENKAQPPQEVIDSIVELSRIKSLDYDLTLEEVSETNFQYREYARYYADENIIPVHIEEPFIVRLFEEEDLEVFITGKPDLIFKYSHSTNELNAMDHKRISRTVDHSPMRNQFQMYATALKTDTVIVNKVGFQKTLKPKERFTRQPLIYNEDILEEWRQDVIFTAKEMVIYQNANHFPRNRTSCEKWSGCYLQRYCTTRPRARDFLIGTEYLVGEQWDVTQKLESE